jgi:hypothetical protein
VADNFRAMTTLYEYFAAESDDDAVLAMDVAGGPIVGSGAGAGSSSSGRSWDGIAGGGIDPATNLTDLEELLTGTAYDDIVEDPRSGHTLASQPDQCMVLTLTESLQKALADLPLGKVAAVAGEWSHAEEFGGVVSPGDLTQFLTDFSALARRATEKNQRLYAWVRF